MDNRNVRGGQPGPSARRPAPAGQAQRQAAGNRGTSGAAPGPRGPRQNPQPVGGSRWFRAIIMVLITIGLCGFFALFILQSANDLLGLNQPDNQIEVVIPEGASTQEIGSILKKAGVVDQQATFALYAGMKIDEEGDLLPGKYLFNSNMGYDQLITAMRTGNTQKDVVTITFIEGWSVYEVAKELDKENVCDGDEFLKFLQTGDLGFEFMDQLPTDSLRFRRLEGYIFPDTYEFYVGENVSSVARKFLRNFDSKITQGMKDRMLDLNLSLDEAITLASIIQKEANVGSMEEMKKVSSVFHNRLNLSEQYPKLQSDVTKIYVNNFIKPFQTMRNQPMYDAYNTYERDGLPVGPICNPGADAIEAALYPAETPYYYFVTDVKGYFYYSSNLQEHNVNIATASRVEGEGEIHGVDTE